MGVRIPPLAPKGRTVMLWIYLSGLFLVLFGTLGLVLHDRGKITLQTLLIVLILSLFSWISFFWVMAGGFTQKHKKITDKIGDLFEKYLPGKDTVILKFDD
tara:strand:- start:1199 stop:1501 length:303 start_codon:yes stop_codon:yes gene_type:complete